MLLCDVTYAASASPGAPCSEASIASLASPPASISPPSPPLPCITAGHITTGRISSGCISSGCISSGRISSGCISSGCISSGCVIRYINIVTISAIVYIVITAGIVIRYIGIILSTACIATVVRIVLLATAACVCPSGTILFKYNSIIICILFTDVCLYIIQVACTTDDLKNLFTDWQLLLLMVYSLHRHKGICAVPVRLIQGLSVR